MDLVGATSLIPGPNSTELAIHIGRERAGGRGLVVAGTCFIVPAMLIVLGFAWAYRNYGDTPEVGAVLYGVQPVMIAIVAVALLKLAPEAAGSGGRAALAALVLAAYLLGVNEVLLLFGAGALYMLARNSVGAAAGLVPLGLWPGLPGFAADPQQVALDRLLLVFLKVGALLYGSGYVLLAFLRSDLVERLGWMTEAQLIDAVAVGQLTPGPVFTTATFVGYFLAGLPGALVATIGIFFPSFVFVAVSNPLIPKMRASRWLSALLDGVNAAALALMAGVTYQLARAAIRDLLTAALAVAALAVLLRTRLNNVYLILAGALVGLVARAL